MQSEKNIIDEIGNKGCYLFNYSYRLYYDNLQDKCIKEIFNNEEYDKIQMLIKNNDSKYENNCKEEFKYIEFETIGGFYNSRNIAVVYYDCKCKLSKK